jgi:hypothetical protein
MATPVKSSKRVRPTLHATDDDTDPSKRFFVDNHTMLNIIRGLVGELQQIFRISDLLSKKDCKSVTLVGPSINGETTEVTVDRKKLRALRKSYCERLEVLPEYFKRARSRGHSKRGEQFTEPYVLNEDGRSVYAAFAKDAGATMQTSTPLQPLSLVMGTSMELRTCQ